MKITTNPAPKARWAKRSLSIAVCAAMLLTGLVFANTMSASAGLVIEAPPQVTFVVPETIYMTPMRPNVSAAPQFFMNNKVDGTAVQDPTESERLTGKIYIQVPGATRYRLTYNNGVTTTEIYDSNTAAPGMATGALVTTTVGSATAGMGETTTANSQNSAAAREWKLVVTVDSVDYTYYHYSVTYHPVWVPSVYGSASTRGNRGINMNHIAWIEGLQKNWNGVRNAGADNTTTNATSNVHGRVYSPTSTTTRKFLPMLGLIDNDAFANTYFGYLANPGTGGETLQTTAVGGGNATGRAAPSNFDPGDNNYTNAVAGSAGSSAYLSPATNGLSLAAEASWGQLYVDTSRHTNYGSIPNFAMGSMITWIDASSNAFTGSSGTSRTGSLRPLTVGGTTGYDAYPDIWHEAYSGDVTSTTNFQNVAGLTRVSTTFRHATDVTQDRPRTQFRNAGTNNTNPITSAMLKDSRTYTDASLMRTVAVQRDWFLMTHVVSMVTANTNNKDWTRFRLIFRINTPRRDKSDLRKTIKEAISTENSAGYLAALKDACLAAGNPAAELTQAQLGDKATTLKNAASSYFVGQHYHFHDPGRPVNMWVGNGSAPTDNGGSFQPVAGATYVTVSNNYASTGTGMVDYFGTVTGTAEPFVGYTCGEVVVYLDLGGTSQTLTSYATPSHREEKVKTRVDFAYQYDPITYKVHYDPDGGTSTVSDTTHTYNVSAPLSTDYAGITKSGYDCYGWSDTQGGTPITGNVMNLASTQDAVVTLYPCWTPATHVYFNPGSGTVAPLQKTVIYDKTYGALPTPTRTGYTFKGWFKALDSDGIGMGDQVRSSTKVTQATDHTLYAQWEGNDYDVILDANGGVPLKNFRLHVKFGSPYSVTTLEKPKLEGYKFLGWSLQQSDPLLSYEVKCDTIVAELTDHFLYAQWEPEKYNVTFDFTSGSGSYTTIQVTYDANYPAFPTVISMPPGATGLDGWFLNGVRVPAGASVKTADDHTLVAKWIYASSGVTFIKNGGAFAEDTLSTKAVVAGEKYGFLPTPTMNGYSFGGWWSTLAFDEDDCKLTGHQTVCAKALNPSDDCDCGYDDGLCNDGNKVCVHEKVTADTLVTNPLAHNIYAKWIPKDYTITFDPAGGILTVPAQATKVVTFNTKYGTTLPQATRDGYDFVEWSTKLSGGTPVVDDVTLMGTYYSHTLYAIWDPVDVIVKFDANGGPALATDTDTFAFDSTYGSHGPLPDVGDGNMSARMGYTFAGWWTSRTAGTKIGESTKVNSFKVVGTDNVSEIYAHWVAQPITVTFEDPDGGNLSKMKEVALDAPYGVLPTVTRTGYEFAGWWTLAPGVGTQVTDTTMVSATATPHSLYADWTPRTDIEVTLNPNGGTGPAAATFNVTFTGQYGANLDPATNPVGRTGYTFDGWFTAKTDGTKVEDTTAVTNAKDHTLYARWTGDPYVVYFYNTQSADLPSVASQPVAYGSAYGPLADITRAGYDLEGWFADDDGGAQVKAAGIHEIEQNLNLYAHWTPKQLKVSFDANGGGAVPNMTVEYGTVYPTLPTPTRKGYECVGWFDAAIGGNEITAGDPLPAGVTDNHTLYAQWTAIDVTVTLDTNGGGTLPAITVKYDGTYGEGAALPVPVYDDHVFRGWWTAQTGGTRVKDTTKVTNDVAHTLYAHWDVADTPVTLNYNDGRADKVIYVNVGGKYVDLADPVRKGYTFDGWYSVATGGTQKVTAATDVTSPVPPTLWAYWTVKQFVVTFDENYVGKPTPTTKTIAYGANYDLPASDPVRAGYDFAGWWTDSALGTQVEATTPMTKEAPHTLYAHWTPKKVKIIFDENDPGATAADPADKDVTVGQTYGVLATTALSGYTLDGWFTAATGGTKVTASSIVEASVPATLYAHWTPVSIKLTFEGNGGTPAQTSQTVTYTGTYGTLPADPERAGYTFAGWWTTDGVAAGWNPADGTVTLEDGVKITATDTVTSKEPFKLYARWLAKTYTVTFLPNTDATVALSKTTMQVKADQAYNSIESLATATRTGYTLDGWYTKPTLATKVLDTDIVTNYVPHDLYAKWTANTYVLNYVDTQIPIETLPSANVTYGQTYAGRLPAMTPKVGYTFAGWWTTDGTALIENGVKVDAATVVTATAGPITLYARWEQDAVDVLFNYNDGDVPTTETKVYPAGSTYAPLPVPTARTGYGFDGWYISKTGGSKVLDADPVDPGVATLYARWIGNPWFVKYDLNYSGAPVLADKHVVFGSKYGALEAPARTGYTFDGWWTTNGTAPIEDGEKIDKNSIVDFNSDIPLYARWKANTYTLTFNGNGGTPVLVSKVITFGEPYGALTTAAREGYNFLGWSSVRSGGTPANEITPTTVVSEARAQTIYAQWEAKAGILVSFDTAGGSPAPADIPVTFGAAYGTLPTVTKTGSDFLGWYTALTGGTKVTDKTIVENQANHTLYARWDTKLYGVYFDPSDGAVNLMDWEGKYIEEGKAYGTLPVAARDGYEFLGWFTAAAGGTQVTEDTIVPLGATSAPHTLYARWSSPKSYTVTFESLGGSAPSPASKLIAYSTAYGTLPTVTRTGYTFGGWWTSAGGGKQITAASVLATAENHTLYARWKAIGGIVSPTQPSTQPSTAPSTGPTTGPTVDPTKPTDKIELKTDGLPLDASGTIRLQYRRSLALQANKAVDFSLAGGTRSGKKVIVDPQGTQTQTAKITSKRNFFWKSGTAVLSLTDGVETATYNVIVKPSFWQYLIIILLFGWIWY